ncbi:MAG: DNA topology modulation protein [Ignavibacteriae bacterium]|nr:MAG: DNA topology modulation protein [Ignavibacteriota bacterium]
MNKICIVGCGGSGKSTLSRKLGEATGIPVYHLDVYYWKPGWKETEDVEWKETVHTLLQNEKWIMDGNFNSTQEIRFAEADTIIFLDIPTYKCVYNAVKRVFIYNKKNMRPDMAEGCNEKFDWKFYKWILTYKKKHGKILSERLEKLKGNKDIIILKSFKEMDEFVKRMNR